MEHVQPRSGNAMPASDSLLRLPNEILCMICEGMADPAYGNPDTDSLWRLSWSCRLMREIARRSLLTRIEAAHPVHLIDYLHSIIRHSETDLVRSANFSDATRYGHGPFHGKNQPCDGNCRRPGDLGFIPTRHLTQRDSPLARLLDFAGVKYTSMRLSSVPQNQRIESTPCELGILVALALSALPKLSKIRLPINGNTLKLDPQDFGPTAWRAADETVEQVILEEKHFPPLPHLQELDLDFGYQYTPLSPDHISWTIPRARNLVTLRLINNRGLDGVGTPWPRPTIQRLSLNHCSTLPHHIAHLVASCPQLRHLKVTFHELQVPGRLETKGRLVTSAMLAELAPVASRLETLFLCGNDVDPQRWSDTWLEDINSDFVRRTRAFTSLRTLSLAKQNLFEPHESKERDVDILADIVKYCPSIENLHILQNEFKCARCGAALYRSLKSLYDHLDHTRVSKLREMKLWEFHSCDEWKVDKWDSDGSQSKDDYYVAEEGLLRGAGMAIRDLVPLFESLGITFKYELGTGAEKKAV